MVEVGERLYELDAQELTLEDEKMVTTLSLWSQFPLILKWQRGDTSLTLESVSPAVYGQVIDTDTELPVSGAVVEWPEGARWVRTAADGSFVLPISQSLFRRLILVLDDSGSMAYGLDPKDEIDRPVGERRIDALRNGVHSLLNRIPSGVEVALWSLTEKKVDFTTNLDIVRDAVTKLEPYTPISRSRGPGTPITRAVERILKHVQETPISRAAVVVLLSDGMNTDEDSAWKTYEAKQGRVIIHTIGFAIEPGSAAEYELSQLAIVSGGKYHQALTEEELKIVFRSFTPIPPGQVKRFRVSAPQYFSMEDTLASSDLGLAPLEIRLAKRSTPGLLTVRRENIDDLDRVENLSAKARQMIVDRVSEDEWYITIPLKRVGIGSIEANGWFEIEEATGRVVGRTEDGLHGSIAADLMRWPARKAAGKHPFVAWYQGIVAYTTGSVVGALKWHSSEAFEGTNKDFARFVQVNALQFSLDWWGEIGLNVITEHGYAYWEGVCMNFAFQSHALGNPIGGDDCFRTWASVLCEQLIEETLKMLPVDYVKGWILGKKDSAAWSAMVEAVRRAGNNTLADELEKSWNEIVEEGIGCHRLREP